MKKKDILYSVVVVNTLIVTGLAFSLFVAAGKAGTDGEKFFNVWTAFLFVSVEIMSFYAIFQGHTHFTFGSVVGSSVFMSQVAVAISALSGAHQIGNVSGVTAFAALFFVFGSIQAFIFSSWRYEFLSLSAPENMLIEAKPVRPPLKKKASVDIAPGDQKQSQEEKAKGNELFMLNRFTEALGHYQKAWELDPSNIGALNNIAAVYFKQGEYARCIEQCEKVIEQSHQSAIDLSNFQMISLH